MKVGKANIFILSITLIMVFSNIADAQIRRRRPQHNKKRFEQKQLKSIPSIGVRFGNDFENDQLLLGGHVWIPLGFYWKFAPGFEYYFVDEEDEYDRWQFNADFIFKPRPNGAFYLGGGVAVDHVRPELGDNETVVGGNVIAGLDFFRFRGPGIYPYVQVRYSLFDDSRYFSALGGLNFALK